VRAALSFFLTLVSLLAADDFGKDIKPVLSQNCAACHNPASPRNRIDFLKANTAEDLNSSRLMWRDVATQLRNRTMPPMASKLTEADRLRISTWIDERLRTTACASGEAAVAIGPRRMNRREYHNTIRDLLGIDVVAADLFPADESGGNGFDTNGDTLYLPPMLLERYLEAAQKVLDRVIITSPSSKLYLSAEMNPLKPSVKPGRMLGADEAVSAETTVFVEGPYNLKVSIDRPKLAPVQVSVQVDDGQPMMLFYARDSNGGATTRVATQTLTRGVHRVVVKAAGSPIEFFSLTVEQKTEAVPQDKRAFHYRLFGLEPGESPVDAHGAARALVSRFLTRAYRRPALQADTDRFYAIYLRAAERGDPYEEAVKMALKAVLVSPRFLFRVEDRNANLKTEPVGQFDMASRLSYFLWSTMPDEELLSLAAKGQLQDAAVLRQQVDRMLDDPRSRAFSSSFVGQWLNTQEVGGRVVPLLTELQHFYTPEVAADLREEPVLLFHHILTGGRSLLELIQSNYTFLTARLAKFYQVEDKISVPLGNHFQKVTWPDQRRAGVLGMASVLAMTSHYKQTSPVLRGAWVLDTLLGTPVPPPPPDVPPLEQAARSEKGLPMKTILARHREDAACASCHNLMDPIGYGLEHFDWMGRWRDEELAGRAVDAKGTLPSGESFDGAVELRRVLLSRKEEFLRHVSGKMLGYALGRVVEDADQCTIQKLVEKLEANQFNARLLVHEVVQSSAFRNHHSTPPASQSSATGSKRVRTRLLGDK
jgi:cytochrome c553